MEHIPGDDCFMMITKPVLLAVIVIFLGFMVQKAGRPGFSGQDIPTMALILKDTPDEGRFPPRIPKFRLSSILR